jgi:outer membrane protein assembly factor BamD
MKMRQFLPVALVLLALLFSACRSEFEQVRTSGDPEKILAKAEEYFEAGEWLRAQTLFELVVAPYRGRPEAEQIALNLAYTYYNTQQYILASYYFKNFAQTYGISPRREEADFMAAFSNYQLSPTFRLDQTYTLKAIEAFEEFANQYPNSERLEESNRLIDEMRAKLERKDFESAQLYYELQQYQSAVRTFENLLKDYPDTDRAEEIRYLVVRAAFQLASNSFIERQRERYEEVLPRARLFLRRYPDSEYRNEVADMLENSEKRLNQLQDVGYQNTGSGTRSQR